MHVSVIGLGYVGQSVSMAAHKAGHEVVGIEIDLKKVRELSNLGFLVTSDFSFIEETEIVVIAVPTPLNKSRLPDTSFIEKACLQIAVNLPSSALVINESTSYPGTLRNLIKTILGNDKEYASAPERIDPGNSEWTIENTPRIVGGLTDSATSKAASFYRSFCQEVIEVSSAEVAELSKLFENTFRQVNIALANEFSQIAQALGIPTFEALAASATKPYGFMSFLPSIGVGGHCIPIDPSYLSYISASVGVKSNFIELANQINSQMPILIAERIHRDFNISGKSVQIAGISYKPGVADTRESPAIALIRELRANGADVSWADPFVESHEGELSEDIKRVDVGVICTAHPGVDYSPWLSGTTVIDVSTSKDLGWPKYL